MIVCRVKDNVKNAGGVRLNSNFELFTIGFHSADNVRSMDHFNFDANEIRSNVVQASAITSKLKHSGDNKIVNVYQKPRALLDWVVTHFSYIGDWVLDLCSGSGTGLASSLALGRHCVAVENDVRHSSVLKGRVLALSANLAGDETGALGEGGNDEIVSLNSQLVPCGQVVGDDARASGSGEPEGGALEA